VLLADLLGRVAGCFPRRETRQSRGQMLHGLLMELDDHNCWTIAGAAGHRGPHRLQHLLSRAVWDDQQVLDIASAWAVGHPGDGDAVLIAGETADEKSSADCAGAARQYSGTVGGVALCQVAVTLTFATSRGHALIGRALYLPEGCAADEEHRELAGVPQEVLFATKPQLAGDLLDRAHGPGIRAAFVAGDEVYRGRQLRRSIRQRQMGYVLAVRASHVLSTGPGRAVTTAAAARLIPALAPLDRDLPARLPLPRGRRRPAAPARRRLRPGRRADPGHHPGAAAAPARHRHPAAPPRPAPPAALAGLAPPPPAPRPPIPPTLERLRRNSTMITTNYSCRNSHPANPVHQQEVGNVPPSAPLVRADQLERLRSDRHNVLVLIGEHDPRQLQSALISHQPAHR
jgi:DDE superfamily endonuclease